MARFTIQQLLDYETRMNRAQSLPNAPETILTAKTTTEKEADLHNEIIKYCKSKGWIYFHSNMAKATHSTVGQPDFTILADRGRHYFIECKSRTGKLSPEQEGLRRWAYKLGHIIFVARDFQSFLEIVTEHSPIEPTKP